MRDEEKRKLCAKAGVRLVEITCEWNKGEKELIAMIRGVVPDFLDHVEEYKQVKGVVLNEDMDQEEEDNDVTGKYN